MKQKQAGSQDGEGELRNEISTIENRLKYAKVDLKRVKEKDAVFKKDIQAIQQSIEERNPKKEQVERSIRETVKARLKCAHNTLSIVKHPLRFRTLKFALSTKS